MNPANFQSQLNSTHPTLKSYVKLCLGSKVQKGCWQKLRLYADVRAASFISRPPPYHENSGPRSVQFGLGPAGGSSQPQDMNWKRATCATSCSKQAKQKQTTGKIETENLQNSKRQNWQAGRYRLGNMVGNGLPKTENGHRPAEQKVHNVSQKEMSACSQRSPARQKTTNMPAKAIQQF